MNNRVSVGSGNQGNVCGGDMNVNSFVPCKNGDGMLSLLDYERQPYCNNCLHTSRKQVVIHYQNLAVIISIISIIILLGSYFIVVGGLPSFMSFMIAESNTFYDLLSLVLSIALIVFFIMVLCIIIFSKLAKRYNDKYYQLHQ